VKSAVLLRRAAAGAVTGLPVLYNTSFNLFGEPLVCTPRHAVRSFYSSESRLFHGVGPDAMNASSWGMEKRRK
jgi:carbamoyltransferase